LVEFPIKEKELPSNVLMMISIPSIYHSQIRQSLSSTDSEQSDRSSAGQIETLNQLGIGLLVAALAFRTVTEVFQYQLHHWLKNVMLVSGPGWRIHLVNVLNYVYIAINIVITVSIWRGMWCILDGASQLFVNKDDFWKVHSGALAITLSTTLLSRTTYSLLSLPLSLSSDQLQDIYITPTIFGDLLNERSSWLEFAKNTVLSLVVYCLSVITWWSGWGLMDDIREFGRINAVNEELENDGVLWMDLILGFIICTTVYIMQYIAKFVTDKILFAFVRQVLVLGATFGCIYVWRGLWSWFDLYTLYIEERQPQNFLTTGVLSMLLLICFGSLNTASSRGVKRDRYIANHDTTENLFEVEIKHPIRCVPFE